VPPAGWLLAAVEELMTAFQGGNEMLSDAAASLLAEWTVVVATASDYVPIHLTAVQVVIVIGVAAAVWLAGNGVLLRSLVLNGNGFDQKV
jgi:hypothetical protein